MTVYTTGPQGSLKEMKDMSIRQIQDALTLKGKVSKSVVGEIVKRVRAQSQEASL